MTLLLIYATGSIFFSFLCSILEAVLLCVTPTYINVKKKEGKSFAKGLEVLKKDVGLAIPPKASKETFIEEIPKADGPRAL